MIYVDLGRKQIIITFSHPAIPKDRLKRGGPTRFTLCQIYDITGAVGRGLKNSMLIAEGSTACSQQDNFCKTTARKLALQRAICSHRYNSKMNRCSKCKGSYASRILQPNREERTKIWEAYHNRGVVVKAPVLVH